MKIKALFICICLLSAVFSACSSGSSAKSSSPTDPELPPVPESADSSSAPAADNTHSTECITVTDPTTDSSVMEGLSTDCVTIMDPTTDSSVVVGPADTLWNRAQLTWYESYPDPGSEECIEYNGCTWAGYFAALPGQQTEEWVQSNNIIAVHEKDFEKYAMKTLRLRKNNMTIDAVVYDMCSDDDCDGCCTKNAGSTGFLIDIEIYSLERFGGKSNGHGIVQWICLDCEE